MTTDVYLSVLYSVVDFVENSSKPLDEWCGRLCFMTAAVISKIPQASVSPEILALSKEVLNLEHFSTLYEWFDRGPPFDALAHGGRLLSQDDRIPRSTSPLPQAPPPVAVSPSVTLSKYITVGAKKRKSGDATPVDATPSSPASLQLDRSMVAEISCIQSLLQEINPNPVSTEIDDISSSLLELLSDRDAASITLIGSALFSSEEKVVLPDSILLKLTSKFLCEQTPKRVAVAYVGAFILPVVFGLESNASRVLLSCLECLQIQALIDGFLLPILLSPSPKPPQMDLLSRILKQTPLTSSTSSSLLGSLTTSGFSVNDSNSPFLSALFKESPALSKETVTRFGSAMHSSISKDSRAAKSLKVSSLVLAIVQKYGGDMDEEGKEAYRKVAKDLKNFMSKKVDMALKKLG